MKLTHRTNTNELRELLSPTVATVADAEAARDNLLASGWAGYDTRHIPDTLLFHAVDGRVPGPARTIAQCVAADDDVLSSASDLATDANQDWQHEATTFVFADGSSLRVSGPTVEIVTHA